ncbi:MAG: hypothetical protein HOP23_12095 [Methylococcaceae bacterium]|nr:hypothetical protein [Methylococcaceae bacterium]
MVNFYVFLLRAGPPDAKRLSNLSTHVLNMVEYTGFHDGDRPRKFPGIDDKQALPIGASASPDKCG